MYFTSCSHGVHDKIVALRKEDELAIISIAWVFAWARLSTLTRITETNLDANWRCHFSRTVVLLNLYVQYFTEHATFGTSAFLVFSKRPLYNAFSLLHALTFQMLSDLTIPSIVFACFGSTSHFIHNCQYLTKLIAHLLSDRSQACNRPKRFSVHYNIGVSAAFFSQVLSLFFFVCLFDTFDKATASSKRAAAPQPEFPKRYLNF